MLKLKDYSLGKVAQVATAPYRYGGTKSGTPHYSLPQSQPQDLPRLSRRFTVCTQSANLEPVPCRKTTSLDDQKCPSPGCPL